MLRRLQDMGLRAQLMPGGRCVLARMRLQRQTFDTPTAPLVIDEVTFATVGTDRAKCLRPQALFQLPMLQIRDCRDATAIEALIHLAWQRHWVQLSKTKGWLQAIGAHPVLEEERSVVAFPLGGEDPKALGRMIEPHRAILPSRGVLSGIALQRVDDRVLELDPSIQSSIDLEMNVTTRLEQLAQLDRRLDGQQRRANVEPEPSIVVTDDARRAEVMLVGPRIGQDRSCIDALRARGFRVESVAGPREAVAAFDRCSPELVLADVQLGRSEGTELIQLLRGIPGIEEVPVVLIDAHKRPERREVAKRIGAAGYLVHPLDIEEIAPRLDRIVNEPRRRRFTRYNERLAVTIHGRQDACVTTSIGRGGMFLATDEDLPTSTLHECQLTLPGTGSRLRVEGEILYRARTYEMSSSALGVRFRRFPDSDQPLLISYLKNLHTEAPARTV